MLKKAYLAIGLFLCIGLGAAFAMGTKAPNLGIADSFKSSGSSSGSSGRSGGFFFFGGSGGSGGSFGK